MKSMELGPSTAGAGGVHLFCIYFLFFFKIASTRSNRHNSRKIKPMRQRKAGVVLGQPIYLTE